ncbi:MAG TPA: M56 family metallopeptidase [Planctomycetaceae bacterium]|nr:M56 family metallopeptidase [Planctomycetaceae bacterium]
MNSAIEQLNAAGDAWTGLMLAVLWQSTVLAVVIALAALAARRSSPAVRYWLWQILAIKLLVMPFWTVAVPWPGWIGAASRDIATAPPSAGDAVLPGTAGRIEGPAVEPLRFPDGANAADSSDSPRWLARIDWPAWLLVVWAAVVACQVVRIAIQRRRLGGLLSQARAADAGLTARVRRVAAELKLKRAPRVVLAGSGCSPFVCGLRKPVLVLPANLADALDETQLRHVLFHELAHVKRWDLVWGWIPEIARIVYFFHPVAHWLVYRLRLERELACDLIAMTHTGRDARAYAETLVQVVSQRSEPAALRAGAGAAGIDGRNCGS